LKHGFSEQEVVQFHRDGYVIVRGLLPPEAVQSMRDAAQRDLQQTVGPVEFEAETHYPGAPASLDAPGGRTVRRLLQAYARDTVFRDWSTGSPVAMRLRQLIGPSVALSQVHHNCVMTKAPDFSSVTSWHRDIRYWAFERPELVSAWFALGEEHRDNGCLLVLPGTHAMTFSESRLDEAQFLRTEVAENAALLASSVPVELDAGDVLFFHCRLFHAAGSNQTGETKLSPVFTYRAVDNLPQPGTRSARLPDIPLP